MTVVFQFISATVALAVALLAVIGKPKWDASEQGFRRLTPTGRATASLALLAFFSTISLAWIAYVDATEQRTQRQRIETMAHTELRRAIQTMLDPMYIAFSRSTKEFTKHRAPEFELIPSGVNMLDTRIRAALAK